jgi:DNA-binding GntR family transcriptional regulator
VKVERIERDPRGLTSEVRDKIIGAMMAGELVPGDRLILDTLADQLGVSRTPVRDALLRLVSEGIVELADKRGYVFRQLSDAEIEHNLESRIAIESYAAEILAKKGETGIRSARAALDEVHRTPRTSVRAFFEANMHVHRAIVAGTENPQLLSFFDTIWGQAASNQIYNQYYQSTADETFYQDHLRLIDTIALGQPDTARAAMVKHICSGRELSRHGSNEEVRPLSTTLENEAIATVENEATQTDWMGDLCGGLGLIRRLVADGVPQRQVARDLGLAGRRWRGRWRRMVRRSTSGRWCRRRSRRSNRRCGSCWSRPRTCRRR